VLTVDVVKALANEERLQISRGNASMSLRALLDWGIVQRTHKRGDRKEYFGAEQDVWSLFRAIVRERMKREIDPLLASLFEIRDLTGVEVGRRGGAEDKQAVVEHNNFLHHGSVIMIVRDASGAMVDSVPMEWQLTTETDAGVPGNWTVTFNFYGARGRVDLSLLRKEEGEE